MLFTFEKRKKKKNRKKTEKADMSFVKLHRDMNGNVYLYRNWCCQGFLHRMIEIRTSSL